MVGWAGDGFPIYLNRGYREPRDTSSGLTRLGSSYRLKSGTRPSGPGGPYNGDFVEDFEYVAGSGDLDAANGRFQREAGVAVEWVEFPGGTGAMTKALRDESIDVAILLTEGIVADLHRGNPSKIVGTYVGTPLTWGVHVPAGSPVRDVEGLRADGAPARYAVSRMGSGSHLMAVVDARSRGWEPATALEFEIVGGLDLSPILAFFLLNFAQSALASL